MSSSLRLPSYDDLPPVPNMPRGCAWGVFDSEQQEPAKEGETKKDLLGTLNILTPDVIKEAAAEIKEGVSISLNWALDGMSKVPIPGRKKPAHSIHSLREAGLIDAHGWDDEIDFNTQCSSQWDSLIHWHHQPSGLAYNGAQPTKESLAAQTTSHNTLPTLDHWHARGGLVGRGVLIDFKEYQLSKGIDYKASHPHRITVADIEAVAKHQGVEFKQGDIFILRTGFTEEMSGPGMMEALMRMGQGLTGVHGSEDTARWFWNHHFSAVASDNMAFEALPPLKEDGTPAGYNELVLHTYFLSLFGLPIGELWDLSRLGEHAKKTGRYTFFLTSIPLNIPCLVGSPPNALAKF
eukprot:TRINITY_DN4869_c0_g1_i4.p1 TRINITY_DN4869_c0_g1~~TRINITY_DN4869_c0_g1_i4.p1  ORF type:complete len:350 (+),score=68.69 TRINITY_DN4869_c0_g1_i4:39-1088(+)